jgi:hypothetical protein
MMYGTVTEENLGREHSTRNRALWACSALSVAPARGRSAALAAPTTKANEGGSASAARSAV